MLKIEDDNYKYICNDCNSKFNESILIKQVPWSKTCCPFCYSGNFIEIKTKKEIDRFTKEISEQNKEITKKNNKINNLNTLENLTVKRKSKKSFLKNEYFFITISLIIASTVLPIILTLIFTPRLTYIQLNDIEKIFQSLIICIPVFIAILIVIIIAKYYLEDF